MDDLELEDTRGNPGADGDAGFQVLDLVHEEGDPEAYAAAAAPAPAAAAAAAPADSGKVSTRAAKESGAAPDK